jgi:hypothetical protein
MVDLTVYSLVLALSTLQIMAARKPHTHSWLMACGALLEAAVGLAHARIIFYWRVGWNTCAGGHARARI